MPPERRDDPAPRPEAPRRRKRWRRLRWLAAIAGGLLLALVVGRGLWLPAAVERLVPWASERLLPFRITVDEVLAADHDRLAVRGLRMESVDPHEKLRLLAARELDARLSFRRLFGGDVLRAFRELRARDAELVLDLTRQKPDAEDEPPEDLQPPVRSVPRLDVEGLALDLVLPTGERLTAVLDRVASPDRESLRLAGRDLSWRSPTLPVELDTLAVEARFADGRFTGLELTLDGVPRAVDSTLDLSRAGEGVVTWDAHLRPPGGSARFVGRDDPSGLTLTVTTEGVELAPLLRVVPGEDPALDARVDLEAELRVPPAGFVRARGTATVRARELVLDALPPATLEAEVAFAHGRATASRVHLSAGANEGELTDAAVELGALEGGEASLARLLRHSRGELRASLNGLSELLAEAVPSARPPADARASVRARIGAGRVDLLELAVESSAARLELARASIDLPASGAAGLDLVGRLDVQDLSGALEAFGAELEADGRLTGTVSAQGTWPALRGAASIEGSGIALAGLPLGTFALEADATAERVRLASLSARSDALVLEASGRWNRGAGAVEDARLTLESANLARALPDLFGGGRVAVDLRAEGALEELRTRFSLRGSELRAQGSPAGEIAIDAEGVGRTVEIAPLALRLGPLALEAGARATLGPSLAPQELRIERLAFLEADAELLVASEPATIVFGPDELRLDELELQGALGLLRVRGSRAPGDEQLTVDAIDLRPMQILEPFLREGYALGRMDAQLAATRTGGSVELRTAGSVGGLRVPALAAPLELDWQLSQRDGSLAIGGIVASSGEDLTLDLHGELPLDPTGGELLGAGPLELHVLLQARSIAALLAHDPELPQLRGSFELEAELAGDADLVRGSLRARGEELGLARSAEATYALGRLDALVVLDEAVAIDRLQLRLPSRGESGDWGGLTVRGSIRRPLAPRALLEGAANWACAAPANLTASLELPSVAPLAELLGVLGIAEPPLTAGALEARIELAGPLAHPATSARARLRGGTLRATADLPVANLVDAEVTLAGSRLRIEEARGELGGAPFELSGEADFGSQPPALSLHLTGENLLLYRSRGVKVRADADLAVEGKLDALLVSGELALADSRYVRVFEIDLTRRGTPSSGARGLRLFRLAEPPLSQMRFDVRVTSREAFEIKNTTVSGSVRPDLRLRGTGAVPVLQGLVYVDPTTLSLPGSSLKIESGTIQFREEDPYMPVLALRGGTRLRGYDIQVVVSGTLANPEILLSSNPPLPDDELLLLVTTGQVPTEGEAATASDTARILAIYLAKDFLARWLSDESTESEESLLSRFEVVTGEDVSESGADTIWASFRVTQDVLSQRDKLYLTAERDQYDFFNYGVRIVFRFE